MKNSITLLFFFTSLIINSQVENWENYLAKYEKGAGSTIVDLNLKDNWADKNLHYLIITGVTFNNCNKDGLPNKSEFDNLYKISDEIYSLISNKVRSKMAGTFTYQCERLDYVYVKDTNRIRDILLKTFNDKFKSYTPYINIKLDKNWEAYNNFLYPSPEIMEYILNQKVIDGLVKSGDNLEKERRIDHWLYFSQKDKMDKFISFCKQIGYKIESKSKLKNSNTPFQLKISKIDKVELNSISKTTIFLRKKALELDGNYDGWETIAIKD